MAKEILLYGTFYTFSAESFINTMEENKAEDATLRILSNGGDPESSFGMVSKWKEHPKAKKIKVDGYARSTAAFFLCYADYTECLDVTEFLFHRAAYPSWIERDPEAFTDDLKKSLKRVNDAMRAALEAKVSVEKFEKITGVTMDQLFSMDGRIDVVLNAEQAKRVGLVDEIVKITPEAKEEVRGNIAALDMRHEIAASFLDVEPEAQTEKPQVEKNKLVEMDIQKLKAEYPSLYAQVEQVGYDKGVKSENQRISAFMVFADVDLKAVKEAVEGTEEISPKQMAEFSRKIASAKFLDTLEEGTNEEIQTTASEASAEGGEKTKYDTELEAFEAQFNSEFDKR